MGHKPPPTGEKLSSSKQNSRKAIPINFSNGDQQPNSRMSNFTPQNMNAPIPPGEIPHENHSSLKEHDSKKSLDVGPPVKQINKVPQTKEVSNIQSIQGKFQNTTKSASNNTQ